VLAPHEAGSSYNSTTAVVVAAAVAAALLSSPTNFHQAASLPRSCYGCILILRVVCCDRP
jgi:hypothetical protein